MTATNAAVEITQSLPTVTFGDGPIAIKDVLSLCHRDKAAALSQRSEFAAQIDAGSAFVEQLLREDGVVYGVTTGYGDSCTVAVGKELAAELPIHLTRFHGCGLGDHFTAEETRAILAVRLNSLCQGYSGVSYQLLEYFIAMLNHDILPLIPKEGSVGASGDLTPLSYVAGALIGERDVVYQGVTMPAQDAFAKVGLPLYTLRPKEALAIMNGTAVMTALACLAWHRAAYLSQLSTRVTAMACVGVAGNPYHFDEKLFALKPHSGQQRVAAWLREDLLDTAAERNADRLQDRYSLRCAPHVIGVLEDCLPFLQITIENELNSANDNPLIDPVGQRVLHGGHFYGGHIAMAMDTLKTQVANLADLHDRQMALILDVKTNNGLPANLSAARGERAALNHGFKAVQIGCSAWTAEALKLTMPASVFSRSTECHNQDKVSMGTIAARDALRVLELTEQVVVATMLATWQAVELRKQGGTGSLPMSPSLNQFTTLLGNDFQLVSEDRPLEDELRHWLAVIRLQKLPGY